MKTITGIINGNIQTDDGMDVLMTVNGIGVNMTARVIMITDSGVRTIITVLIQIITSISISLRNRVIMIGMTEIKDPTSGATVIVTMINAMISATKTKKNKLMFTHFLNILATAISVVSLLIVTYGALVAFITFLGNELKRFTGQYSTVNIRRLRAELGTYLLLGLELLIASDILKTVLEPSLDELAILGGIVVLRTILSVFLNKEIKELESEKNAS